MIKSILIGCACLIMFPVSTIAQPSALKELPAPASGFTPGTYNYDFIFELSEGRQTVMPMTRTVKKTDNGDWSVTDRVTTKRGDQIDEGIYEKNTLHPLSRKISAGAVIINFTYTLDSEIIADDGHRQAIPLTGAFIHNGGGNDMVLAHLPLKPGYEAYLNVAAEDGHLTLKKLAVTGKETVNGISCYKCEFTSPDDASESTTYYFAISNKMTVKTITTFSGMRTFKTILLLKQ